MSNPPNENLPKDATLENKVENNSNDAQKDANKVPPTARELAKAKKKADAEAKKAAKADIKAQIKALKAIDLDDKVKRKRPLPVRYLAVATLGVEVGNRWTNQYQQLQIPTANANSLLTNSQNLLNLIQQQDGLETSKFNNTKALKEVNKLINNGVSQLKKHIKSEYADQKNWDTYYKEYGLEADNKGTYALPNDNSNRAIALDKLIAKLSEPQNPLARKSFGLAEWQQAKRDHAQEWSNSNTIRSDRSNVSNQITNLLATVRESLNYVQKYVSATNNPADAKAIKRGLGFLKESF